MKALFLLGIVLAATSAKATTELYTDDTENSSSVRIETQTTTPTYAVVYSVPVSVQAGDLMHVMGQFEVTPPGINVAVGSKIILASSSSDVTGSEFIAEATLPNLVTAMGHLVAHPNGMKLFSGAWTGYVNLVVYAANESAPTNPYKYLTIEQGYGELDVALIR